MAWPERRRRAGPERRRGASPEGVTPAARAVEATLAGPLDERALPLPTTVFGRHIYYGWYIVAVVFVVSSMSTGLQAYVLGVFVKPMTEELGWTRTDFTIGGTISIVVSGLAAVVVGPLVDRHGGRKLVIWGGVIGGLGFIALGAVHELWQFLLIRGVVITIGSLGMGTVVLNVALSNWFVRMRGRAIAIGSMGISLAALALPSMSTWLIDHGGWRQAWVVLGVLVIVTVVPGGVFVLRRPDDYGLLPDGGPPRPGSRISHVQQAGDVRWTARQAARTLTLWMLILAFGLGSIGLGALLLHLIPYLTDRGFTPSQAASSFVMIGVSGLVTKVFWGVALERIETKYIAAFDFLLFALALVMIMAIQGVLSMYVAVLMLGIAIGGVVTIQEVVWANYFGRLTLGAVRAVGRPVQIITGVAGPLLASAAYDLRGSYEVAFGVFALTSVLAAVIVVFTPRPTPPAAEASGG